MELHWSNLEANAEAVPEDSPLSSNSYVTLIETVIASLDQGNGGMVKIGRAHV